LANVHHRAAKRDGVRSPGVRVHTKPWLITNVKKTGIEPVFHHNYSFFISGRTSILQNAAACDDQEDKDYNKDNRKMSLIIVIFLRLTYSDSSHASPVHVFHGHALVEY